VPALRTLKPAGIVHRSGVFPDKPTRRRRATIATIATIAIIVTDVPDATNLTTASSRSTTATETLMRCALPHPSAVPSVRTFALRMRRGAARWSAALLPAALVLTLAACGGGGGGGAPSGSLRMALTDAPVCGYDAVNVTVQRVRVHQSAGAADGDAGWQEIILSPARRVDLTTLTNGVLAELGQTALPTGKYTQVRLVLAANDATTPLANSVKPTGLAEVALNTPSAQQSGLKMNANIDVAANQTADFVLDFDACKSVVQAGASGNYNLKPVVTVIPRLSSGVVGFVDATVANGNTLVSLQQNGTEVRSTAPDVSGRFALTPVSTGTYTLVITAPGRATTVVTAVPVTASALTNLNTATTQIAPATVTGGTAAGTVTSTTSPIDANIRATQTLTGGTVIEVLNRPVNATTGAYSFALPSAAPRTAAFVAALGALNFVTDGSAGANYALTAVSGATVKGPTAINIGAGGTVTTNFSF